MTRMFVVSSRSRRSLLLLRIETADFDLVEIVLRGKTIFCPVRISLRVVRKMAL